MSAARKSWLQELSTPVVKIVPAQDVPEITRDASFVITVRMPATAKWKQDPTQVAYTVANCMRDWIKHSISSNTAPIVNVSAIQFVDEVREKAIAFELLKAAGHVNKRRAAEALRIARGLR